MSYFRCIVDVWFLNVLFEYEVLNFDVRFHGIQQENFTLKAQDIFSGHDLLQNIQNIGWHKVPWPEFWLRLVTGHIWQLMLAITYKAFGDQGQGKSCILPHLPSHSNFVPCRGISSLDASPLAGTFNGYAREGFLGGFTQALKLPTSPAALLSANKYLLQIEWDYCSLIWWWGEACYQFGCCPF